MMHHIRPWQLFRHLDDLDHSVQLMIPAYRGTQSLTIKSIETILLVAAARIVNAKSILEIGTSMGYTALHLAMNLSADIYTIDRERKPHAFAGTDCASRIKFIQSDVIAVDPFPVDMAFCDCNYSPALTLKCTDLAMACQPRVVAWHDYGNPESPLQKETLESLPLDIYHVEDTWLVFWFAEGLEI